MDQTANREGAASDGLLDRFRETLAAHAAEFHRLIDCLADGVLVLGLDGGVRYSNPAAGQMLGRSREALVGQPFGIPALPGETAELDLVGMPGGRVAELRAAAVNWDGEPALVAVLRDVTDRKRAEDAVRFLAEASRELAGSLDETTTLAAVLRLAATHLADWCILVPADGPMLSAARNPLDIDNLRRLQQRHSDPHALAVVLNGVELTVTLTAREKPLGTLTLIRGRDVPGWPPSDVGLAEDFARRASAALDNARLYRIARDEAHRRAEFLALLGHELRNPLAALSGAVPQLAPGPATDVVARQTRHMRRLVDDLLEAARVTRGQIQLHRQRVDVAVVAADAIQGVRQLATEQQVDLVMTVPAGQFWVDGDPTRLTQVLTNLLHNATRYTDPGGRVELTATRIGTDVVLTVTDTGAGIPAEVLPRLFEPLAMGPQPLDRSRGGLGLGLALVRCLTELHGGTVEAHSDGPGKGSKFTVRLPRADAATTVEPLSVAGPQTPRVASRRVLLIEDHADNRAMLGQLLELWGHQVSLAEDGPTGLEKLLEERPEIALVDIGLPGLDGYEVARRVRAAERLEGAGKPRLLLVALTGYGHAEARQESAAAGFDHHLVKPVDLDILARLLTSR